mgnify:CR=1 FL=1
MNGGQSDPSILVVRLCKQLRHLDLKSWQVVYHYAPQDFIIKTVVTMYYIITRTYYLTRAG